MFEKPSDALLSRLNIHPTHIEHISASVDTELEMTEDFVKCLMMFRDFLSKIDLTNLAFIIFSFDKNLPFLAINSIRISSLIFSGIPHNS